MAVFEFKAIDSKGKQQKGYLEGDSVKDIGRKLSAQGLHPLEINQSKKKIKNQKLKRQLSILDVAVFIRQLSSLVQASVPIDESLRIIMQNANNSKINKVISETIAAINEGQTLANSLRSSSHPFAEYHLQTISAGERGSKLGIILEKLAIDIERQFRFKAKISNALIYPLIISMVSVAVVSALLVLVVPQIVSVFNDTGQVLPPLTIAVINISDFLSAYYMLIIAITLGFVIGLKIILKNQNIKLKAHQLLAKIPIINKLVVNLNAVRFARTLSLLYESGMPIVSALQHSSSVLNFLPMKKAVLAAADRVREGSNIYTALDKYKAIPTMFLYMLASGESSGRLGEMLNKAAENQEHELSHQTSKIISIVEPLMIVITGGMVLLIVMAILLPIFEINTMPL